MAVILLATLTPQMGSSNLRQGFFAPLTPGTIGASFDLLQNVLLYVPLGVAFALRRASWLQATAFAALLSLSVELCQFFVPGRDPVATDVLVNTAGASIAWLVMSTLVGSSVQRGLHVIERWLAMAWRPSSRAANWLSLAWASTVCLLIGSTCWLLSASLPDPFYFLISSPRMDQIDGPVRIGSDGTATGVFRGEIDEVRIFSEARAAADIATDMQQPVSAVTPEAELVVAYGFDAGNGESVADGSGRGHDALRRQTTWTPSGKFGGALTFNGTDSEVIVPGFPQLHLQRAMTIEAWVKPAGHQRGRATIAAHTAATYFLRASSLSGALHPSGGGRFGENPREARLRWSIPPGVWTHLAVSYDGQGITLFINANPTVRLRHWSPHHTVHAIVDGMLLPPGFAASASELRTILSGRFELRMLLRCGAHELEPGPVFEIIGVQSREALVVDASGSELRVRPGSPARTLGLAPTEFRLAGALQGCEPGGSAAFVMKGPLQNPQVLAGDGRVVATRGPGIGSAWALLFDSRLFPARAVTLLSTIFLAVVAAPYGFFARWSRQSVIGVLMLAGTAVLAPMAWGTPAIDVAQSAGMVIGILAGAAVRIRCAPAPS